MGNLFVGRVGARIADPIYPAANRRTSMRRIVAGALVAASLIGTLLVGPQASAAVIGGGVFEGTITWPSGLDLTGPCPSPRPSPFFEVSSNTTLTISDGERVFAGTVTTQNVHGDMLCGGRFTLNSASDPATFSGTDAAGQTFSGSFYGSVITYQAVVFATLHLTGRIGNGPPFSVIASLDPALVIPTEADRIHDMRSARLAGRYSMGRERCPACP